MTYNWNWSIFFLEVPSGEGTYLDWIIAGLQMTVQLSLSSWVIALFLGSVMGVFRTLPNRYLSSFAASYVEVFRNVPILVQLFFWYFVLPEILPVSIGDSIKQTHPVTQQFLASMICLAFFTSARIAEQVRAGIQSLSGGQELAGMALGFTIYQNYRFVLLPMAFRIILPPLTSEILNLFKNSAVCSTIGLLELTGQSRQLLDYTAQPYESFLAVTLLYLVINMIVMLAMQWLEKLVRIPGMIGARHA